MDGATIVLHIAVPRPTAFAASETSDPHASLVVEMAKDDEGLPVHVSARFLLQVGDDDARECVAEAAHRSGAHLLQFLPLDPVAIVRDAAAAAIGVEQTSPQLARKGQSISSPLLLEIELLLQGFHFAVLVVATPPKFVQAL